MIEEIASLAKEANNIKEVSSDTFTDEDIGKKMDPKELLKNSEKMGISRSDEEIEGIKKEISDRQDINDNSEYSDEINDRIRTPEELKIYEDAELKEVIIGDKPALVRGDIDLEQIDEYTGQTNLERMEKGKPPLDKDGNPIELHHVGQKPDSPLAELTQEEHRGKGNDNVLHDKTQDSEIDRLEFAKEKREYWKARAEEMKEGEN